VSSAEFPATPPSRYDVGRGGEDPRFATVPPYEASLWRRQTQFFAGDPAPGNQHLAPPVAANPIPRPDFAISAVMTVTGDFVRVSVDGTVATAVNGFVALVGSVWKLTGRATLTALSIFPNSAAAVVDIVYFD
jgi:hypothetical protein